MRKTKKQKEREQRENGLLILWCLSERNNAREKYTKAVRKYCLTCENWAEVCEASANAHRHGISDEELIEIDIEVQNSITDEEIYAAVYGE